MQHWRRRRRISADPAPSGTPTCGGVTQAPRHLEARAAGPVLASWSSQSPQWTGERLRRRLGSHPSMRRADLRNRHGPSIQLPGAWGLSPRNSRRPRDQSIAIAHELREGSHRDACRKAERHQAESRFGIHMGDPDGHACASRRLVAGWHRGPMRCGVWHTAERRTLATNWLRRIRVAGSRP